MSASPDRIACLKRVLQTEAAAGAGIPTRTSQFSLDKTKLFVIITLVDVFVNYLVRRTQHLAGY